MISNSFRCTTQLYYICTHTCTCNIYTSIHVHVYVYMYGYCAVCTTLHIHVHVHVHVFKHATVADFPLSLCRDETDVPMA